jgi:hypothetical protein
MIVGASAAVADRGPVRAGHGTRPPFAHRVAIDGGARRLRA